MTTLKKMIYYSKITTKHTKNKAIELFKLNKIPLNLVTFDEGNQYKVNGSVYNTIKEKLLKGDKMLTIDVINSLGKNNREIANELKWMLENNISLIVLDISQTKVKGVNACLFLYEVYKKLADVEIANVKKAQRAGIDTALNNNSRYGRPKIEYPKNWNELYMKWKDKKISSGEFIKFSGLKKPTFYKMLKEYMVESGEIEVKNSIKEKNIKVS